MKLLFLSFFDESCMGMRSVGASLEAAGHEARFLSLNPFRYPLVPHLDRKRIDEILAEDPLAARDPHPLGDVFVWASPLTETEMEVVLGHVASIAPDAVGMTVVMGMERTAAQVTSALEGRFPNMPVIWGGVLPTLTPEVALRHARIVCVAEGEAPMVAFAKDPSRRDVPGLWFRDGETVTRNRPEPPPPMEALPPPLYAHAGERTLLDGVLSTRSQDDVDLVGHTYVFMASRGCRFDCSYCLSGRIRKTGARSPRDRKPVEQFVGEIERASRRFRLQRPLLFWDDIFTDDEAWLAEFAQTYPREVGIPFACQTHPDRCSPEALRFLMAAGVHRVAIGLESGSSRVLREVYGRQPDVERVIALAHRAQEAGVPQVQVDLVTNCPYETEADCRETLETILRLPRPYLLEIAKLVIYPGSRLASYEGPHGGMTERGFDAWNMLYLMSQYAAMRVEDIRALAADRHVLEHPEILRGIAHALETAQDTLDAAHGTIATLRRDRAQDVAAPEAFTRALQALGHEAAPAAPGGNGHGHPGARQAVVHPSHLPDATANPHGDVLLVGAGPLPAADSTRLCSYNLRTAKIAWLLSRKGIPSRLLAVDIFEPRSVPTAADSLVGPYELLPGGDVGVTEIRRCLAESPPRAVVAVSAAAAAMVSAADPAVPVWADLPGWQMPEAQLKAITSGDDRVLAHYRDLETEVLSRADRISVVSENQKRATEGELALLGRMSRRNAGHALLHRMPSLAFDWTCLLNGDGRLLPRAVPVPEGAPVLLWSGSLNLWTDPAWLEGLLSELMERLPTLHFVATGIRFPGYNDEHCDRLERFLATAPFSARGHVLSSLPFADAVAWYGRATLGICIDGDNAEVAHGSRTRLVEMLSHGLPAAATTGTELASDLAAAGAILPLPPDRRDGWADAIAAALADPAELGRLRDAGQAHVTRSYGLETCTTDLLAWLAAPALAPDNALRRLAAPPPPKPATVPPGPDDALRASRPMATWRAQSEIETAAHAAMAPSFTRTAARLVRRALVPLLVRKATRIPVLSAWNAVTRISASDRLAHWQSFIDEKRPRLPPADAAGTSEWLAADAAKRVYGRVVGGGGFRGDVKSCNVLLARYERDVPTDLQAWPQRIEIEPSSLCNIRCRQCQLTHMEGKGTYMSDATFRTMVPYFRYASFVEFIGRGEPMLNPHLPEWMEEASRHGCMVRMFTNGTRMTPELSVRLIHAKVDEIVLSLLAGDRESYALITDADRFDRIVDNFRTLRDLKRHVGSQTPRLSICATLLRGSLDSAPDIVRAAASLEIPAIHFGASYIIMPHMEEESLLKLPREHVERVFQECRELGRRHGIGITLPNLDEDRPPAPPVENRFGCLKPWQSVLVRADGEVEVCSYNRKIVGDLQKEDFAAIWNGPEYAAFRRDEVRHAGVNYCSVCYHMAFRGKTTGKMTHFPYGVTFEGYR